MQHTTSIDRWRKTSVILSIAIFIAFLSFQFNDTDLYYLIATGRYILQYKTVPHINPFCITENCGIVLQNWLYCVLVAFVYDHFYSAGLWLMQSLLLGVMYIVILAFLNYGSYKDRILSHLLTICTIVIFGYTNLRPEMLTFILVVTQILIIERYMKTSCKRLLYCLPLIILVEANMHASYLFIHFVILLPYCVPMIRNTVINDQSIPLEKMKEFVIPIVLMVFAMFVNPYGAKNAFYFLNALRTRTLFVSGIGEHYAYAVDTPYAVVFLIMVCIFIACLIYRKLDSISFYMFVGFSFLFVLAAKWVIFFALGCLYIFRILAKIAHEKNIALSNSPAFSRQYTYGFTVLLGIGLAGILLCNIDIISNKYASDYLTMNGPFINSGIVQCVKYIKERNPRADVYTLYENNNYLQFCGFRTYTDARPELYSPIFTGGADSIKNALIIENGYNIIDYSKNIIATPDLCDFDYSLSEYGSIVDSVDADYYIVSEPQNILLKLYLDSNEQYLLRYECKNMLVYERAY